MANTKSQGIGLHDFLKNNILDVVSSKHQYKPTCIDYLTSARTDLVQTIKFVNATISVMKNIDRLQNEKLKDVNTNKTKNL